MDNIYYKEENVKLYHGDCLTVLKDIQDNSIDLIFADPPYFLSNDGITCKSGKIISVNKAEWDKSHGFKEDFDFNVCWIRECHRILKDNGSIWISGTLHNIYQVGFALQILGFRILNEISWFKPNAPPNLVHRYFSHAHETLLWARKHKNVPHKFNYDVTLELYDQLSPRGQPMKSVWSIPFTSKSEKNHGKHPTQKPIELLRRVILSTSNENDIVLDPFNGSGTTGYVAKKFNRKYIGIEKEKEFLEITIKRLKD